MKERIINFIQENNITFKEGTRNTDATVLSGYALYIGIKDVNVLIKIIDNVLNDTDDYKTELINVFKFSKKNNYDKWWKTEQAKREYKF